VEWSQTNNIAWKTVIPGIGHSSPIVHGDHVFVTSCLEKDQQRVLFCLDRRAGTVLWHQVAVTAPLEKKHKLNSFSSSTPATDGKHVWVTFLQSADIIVACYDYAGNQVWRKSPGKFSSRHGFCSSPILYKDLIIVNGDQDAPAFLVALDKTTGAERWRADRPNRIRSYCAPLIVHAAGKMQMVLSGCNCVASYDPDTGQQLWIIDGPTEQYVASLVYGEGLFFLTAGFPDFHNLAIKPDGQGNITRTHVLWHEKNVIPKKAAYVPSPIAHGQYFFVVSDVGWLSCFEAKTGKRHYLEQLGRHHSASPVSVNGLLYFPADDGVTYVVKAGPTFELVARNDLGEECYASPAVANGQIFMRTLGHLYCIGKAKAQ
jgi:outer membrane protein assembly factor BamB